MADITSTPMLASNDERRNVRSARRRLKVLRARTKLSFGVDMSNHQHVCMITWPMLQKVAPFRKYDMSNHFIAELGLRYCDGASGFENCTSPAPPDDSWVEVYRVLDTDNVKIVDGLLSDPSWRYMTREERNAFINRSITRAEKARVAPKKNMSRVTNERPRNSA